jgi:putative isomerase
LNFMIWDGLRRYGYWSEATELAHKSWQIFNRGWAARRHAHENFQMFPATGCDAQDSDEFYSWGAMMPLISVLDVTDASPWHGITLVAPTASSERSELETGEGTYALTTLADGTGTMLERDGVPVIRLASRVRISDLRMAEGLIAFSFQPLDGHSRVQLDLVGVPSSAVVAAFVEDQPVPLAGGTATCSFEVDASAEGAVRIELHHRSTFAAGTHSGAIHRVAFP